DSQGVEQSVPVFESGELKAPEWRTTLSLVAPGKYDVFIQTTPRSSPARSTGREALPGLYHDRRRIELKPGVQSVVVFEPMPLDPEAWRGNRAATVQIRPAGDRPLGGEQFRVDFLVPKYGGILVASRKLSDDGKIALKGIAPSGKEPFDGEYSVEVAGDYLG